MKLHDTILQWDYMEPPEAPEPEQPTYEQRQKHMRDFFSCHDFDSVFEVEDFDVVGGSETAQERQQRIGLKLIVAFREDYEEHFGLEFTGVNE